MVVIIKYLSIPVMLFLAFPLLSQNSEILVNKIAKAYCDSLNQNIPEVFDFENNTKIEFKVDAQIFTLDNKDMAEYLRQKKQLHPKRGEINADIIRPILQKAITGCEFTMAYFGNGARKKDIKPSLIKYSDYVCNCLESKTKKVKGNEMFESKAKEVMEILKSCTEQSTSNFREAIVEDYNVTDSESAQRFGSIASGYLYISCPKIITSFVEHKVVRLTKMMTSQISNTYNTPPPPPKD